MNVIDIDVRHAICHEAGHVVVGLHFGFHFNKIEVSNWRTQNICDMDSHDLAKRFVFLAGGIAGEKVCFPDSDYDREASADDQKKIDERGGGPIEEYFSEAREILRAHQNALELFRVRLTAAWEAKDLEDVIQVATGGKPRRSFGLLTQKQIDEIWAASRES